MIRQRFHEASASGRFLGAQGVGDADQFRRLALAVTVGPLAHEIDIAGDMAALEDWHLPRHQRRGGIFLQGRDDRAGRAIERIDFIDQNEMRHAFILEHPQQGRDGARAGRIGFADDDGDIDRHDGRMYFMRELDRARTIEDGPCLLQIRAMTRADRRGGGPVARTGRAFDGGGRRLRARCPH